MIRRRCRRSVMPLRARCSAASSGLTRWTRTSRRWRWGDRLLLDDFDHLLQPVDDGFDETIELLVVETGMGEVEPRRDCSRDLLELLVCDRPRTLRPQPDPAAQLHHLVAQLDHHRL